MFTIVAALVLPHDRRGFAQAVPRSLQMHGDHLIELFLGHLAHRRVAGDSGVVDHDVQRAEPVDGRADQCIDVVAGCHIAAHRDGDLVTAELRGRGLRRLEIHVTEHYPGALDQRTAARWRNPAPGRHR